MSNELTPAESAYDVLSVLTENARSKHADDQALAAVTTASSFLPYIKIMQSSSKEVKAREIDFGVFALAKGKKLISLGEKMPCLVLGWRPKAMQYLPSVVSYYDPNSLQFKDIQNTADEQDSNKGYGPEFLLWLPEHQEFVTFFFGNPTGRMEAPNVIAAIKAEKRKARFDCILIENRKKQTWYGPKYNEYDLEMALPPRDRLISVLQKFNDPKDSDKDTAEKAEESEDRG